MSVGDSVHGLVARQQSERPKIRGSIQEESRVLVLFSKNV
jgi:hypothetical protein